MKFNKINKVVVLSGIGLAVAISATAVNAQTIYNLEKINTGFSIDGNGGEQEGQQAYLWSTDLGNINQQWVELDRGTDASANQFYAYQKLNTSLCMDAGDGGAERQAVTLLPCDATDQNQHWQKINLADDTFRLKKRGVSFSIDGNGGAAPEQLIYLWHSQNSNVNQQWVFTAVGSIDEPDDTADGVFNLQKNNTDFSIDGNGGARVDEQVYLWNTDDENVNQQWAEFDRGNGFVSYQKMDTNLCLDGGDGGAEEQAIILSICDANEQNQHWEKISIAGGSIRLKKRGVSFSMDGQSGGVRRQLIELSASQNSDVDQQWIFRDLSTSSSSSGGTGDFNLDPNLEPWENFDLSDWALDAPNADPDDGLSARTDDADFIAGELFPGSEPFFFTGTDGAMVFRSTVGGALTSANTSFPRSELREMLRAGADGISTTGVNENNWVLGYQPNNVDFGAHTSSAQDETPTSVGGRNGVLRVTMRVNQVTTTGDGTHPGRVIIGQIHADDDEPLRLYYRKLPNNENGSIYFSHEIRDGDDIDDVNLIGSESSSLSNPSNGFALGDLFSYEIINEGSIIEVIIRDGDQDGLIVAQGSIDMNEEGSGYDIADEWMYFKAGAYTQNNTGDDDDFDEVAIYRLENTHD